MDPVRLLALLWRGCSDLDGAAIWSREDIETADLAHVHGFGHVEKRRPKPHQQLSFEQIPADEQWVTYFVPNDIGRARWRRILDVAVEPHTPTAENYGTDGKVHGAGPAL